MEKSPENPSSDFSSGICVILDTNLRKKFYSKARNFLEYLYRETGDVTFRELKEVLDRPQRPSKKLKKIIIRPVDVEKCDKKDFITLQNLPPCCG